MSDEVMEKIFRGLMNRYGTYTSGREKDGNPVDSDICVEIYSLVVVGEPHVPVTEGIEECLNHSN